MSPVNARTATTPILAVSIGGDILPGVVDVDVTQSVSHECDSFHVALSLSALQAARSPYGWDYWAAVDQVVLELRFGFVEEGGARHSAPFFTGYADSVSIDPVRTEVSISGRDASALMAEQKLSEDFLNHTSSAIAIDIANRNGLTPDVQPTTHDTGRFYEADHVRLARAQSQWELLTFLAEQEGFETYVTGTTLYFGPRTTPEKPFEIRWTPPDQRAGTGPACNAISLVTERNLAAARGVEVTVSSWNRKLGRSFTATRTSGTAGSAIRQSGRGSGAGRLGNGPQRYSFDPPDLDQRGVERFAEQELQQLCQHEMRLSATFGAETTLGQHSVLRLSGTGTAFDQDYYPEEIRRVQSYDSGFTTTVTAKNSQARNQPRLPDAGAGDR